MKKVIAILIALLVIACAFAVAEEAACDHNYTVKPGKAATCTEAGTIIEYCTKCGTEKEETNGSALGHNYKVDKVEPTCTEGGKIIETCTRCGKTNEEAYGSALGHNFTAEKVDATCTESAKVIESCTRCTYKRVEDVAPALGHDYSKEDAEIPATCSKEGTKAGKTCTRCNDKQGYGVIPKLPHTEETIPGYASNCTVPGKTDGKKCSVCNEIILAQDELPLDADAHDFMKHNVVKPTVNRRGYTEYKCTRCGIKERRNYTDKLVVEAVAVDAPLYPYGSIVTDLDDNAKPYTAEVDKEAKHVCIFATDENGVYPLRELHLSLGLIAELKADGIEEICFTVGEAEIVIPFSAFDGEIMETVKADFPATLTGYIVTLDPTAKTAEGVEGCLVRIDMTADTEEADGIELEITGVMSNVNLFLGEVMFPVNEGKVFTA